MESNIKTTRGGSSLRLGASSQRYAGAAIPRIRERPYIRRQGSNIVPDRLSRGIGSLSHECALRRPQERNRAGAYSIRPYERLNQKKKKLRLKSAAARTGVYDIRMAKYFRFTMLGAVLTWTVLLTPAVLAQTPVTVRQTEGLARGFLVLRSLDGSLLAQGELEQLARGERVTSKLALHFKDGSLHEEIVIFSQRQSFRLLSYRLVQKGPAFKVPMEVKIESSTGQATVRYTDEDGKEKVESERLKLPADLANGMLPVLLKNIPPGAKQTTVSYVAATPKPRLVKLVISPEGEAQFMAGGSSRKATQYLIHVDIGGIAGFLAPIMGKQPQDSHAWIIGGEAPAFVKLEGPLFMGGPSWRIELASPVWQGQ